MDGTRRVVEVLRERSEQHRLVPGRRALEREHAGRHHQDRPPRQLERPAHGARRAGTHRLSAVGGQSGACCWRRRSPSSLRAPGITATSISSPPRFQVSNISAGTGAPNVIPGELRARFNLRFSTEQTVDGLKLIVEEILQRHRVKYTLEWFISGLPFLTVPGRCRKPQRRAVAGTAANQPQAHHRRRHLGRAFHRARWARR